MLLPLVTETLCRTRAHCAPCRASKAFRDDLAKHYTLPPAGIELCPFGVGKSPQRRAAAPAISLQKPSYKRFPGERELWEAIHRLAFNEPTREMLEALLARIPCGECQQHSLAYLKKHPPDFSSPDACLRWSVEFHNDVARHTHGEQWTVERAACHYKPKEAPRDAIQLHTHSMGLGDAVCGLYAVCGFADAIGKPVVYNARSDDWIGHRFHHPNVYILPNRNNPGFNYSGGLRNYHQLVTQAPSFTKAYTANLAKQFKLSPFEAARPKYIDASQHQKWHDGRYAVLSPFCCHAPRNWPVDRWAKIAARLMESGIHVFAVASAQQAMDLNRGFSATGATLWAGKPAADVMDLIAGAEFVLGNDSGIAHVGGMLGKQTIAVHAGAFSHDFLYDCAPSVRSVIADYEVSRGDNNRAALNSVTTNRVIQSIFGRSRIPMSQFLFAGQ